jgi:hypothetical protein
VFTEGERTEDGYLVYWRREFRDTAVVTVDDFHGGPLQLVDRAVEAKRREALGQRRSQGKAHDEVWCVFDRDEHPNFARALEKAAANGIGVAVSNPCIEVWFILHFADQNAYLEREEAQRRSRELLGCEKALTPGALEGLGRRYEDARQRARGLDMKHEGDGSPAHSNPSSTLWKLIDRIRDSASK